MCDWQWVSVLVHECVHDMRVFPLALPEMVAEGRKGGGSGAPPVLSRSMMPVLPPEYPPKLLTIWTWP